MSDILLKLRPPLRVSLENLDLAVSTLDDCLRDFPRRSTGSAEASPIRLAGSAELETMYFRLGDVIAALHEASDLLTLPDEFARPSWDHAAFTGGDPFWVRYWENPSLSADEVSILLVARALLSRDNRLA